MTERGRAWLAAVLWWAGVLVLVPSGRRILDPLRALGWLGASVTATLAVLVAALAGVAVVKWRRGAWGLYQLGATVGLSFILLFATQALPRAEERWHVVQYATLGALLWAASTGTLWRRWLFGGGAAGVAGWIDEGVQKLLPDRVYDWGDVVLNLVAGMLGALIAGLCVWAGHLDRARHLRGASDAK